MKKKLVTMFSAFLLASTLANVGVAYANNYENKKFQFQYTATGSDTSITPEKKEDETASYVKLTSTSIDMMVYVEGTNNKNVNPPTFDRACSNVVLVKKGDYKYISNTVHDKYQYAYLAMGSDIGGTHLVKGEWSPDNISGRY